MPGLSTYSYGQMYWRTHGGSIASIPSRNRSRNASNPGTNRWLNHAFNRFYPVSTGFNSGRCDGKYHTRLPHHPLHP
jgi:hypothetical protein